MSWGKVFDGAAVVHFLPFQASLTFRDYAEYTFPAFVRNQLSTTSRVDIVWDIYRPDSLKESTRTKRGSGKRKKVTDNTRLLQNRKSFMEDPFNKEELFSLLSEKVKCLAVPQGKTVFITSG